MQFCYHAEDILSTKSESILESLSHLTKELDSLASFATRLKSVLNDVQNASASLEEALRGILSFRTQFHYSPERLEQIRERLGELSRLKRKYGGSLEAVLRHFLDLKREVDSFSNLEADIVSKGQELAQAHKILSNKALELSQLRTQAVPHLQKDMTAVLKELGFNYVAFEVRLEQKPGSEVEFEGNKYQITPNGLDFCQFYVGTNPGEPILPLPDIASGGEISRIMLGLKAVIAEKDQPGTLIFDEIDIGISGRVARKVGLKLLQTSKSQQLLVITHLPQIASLPARHFSAVKVEQSGRAFSRFILLEGKERINEIAKLLTTGEAEGKGEDYAKELLEAEDVLQV
jgi:DNA repair protein RecN (Recombination protein N)